MAGSFVVVVSRRYDDLVVNRSVVINSRSAEELVIGIFVNVESVELSEDDALSVVVISNDEYVVSDPTSRVVTFVRAISAIFISIKWKQHI